MGKMEELEARHSELESEVARIRAELHNWISENKINLIHNLLIFCKAI